MAQNLKLVNTAAMRATICCDQYLSQTGLNMTIIVLYVGIVEANICAPMRKFLPPELLQHECHPRIIPPVSGTRLQEVTIPAGVVTPHRQLDCTNSLRKKLHHAGVFSTLVKKEKLCYHTIFSPVHHNTRSKQ